MNRFTRAATAAMTAAAAACLLAGCSVAVDPGGRTASPAPSAPTSSSSSGTVITTPDVPTPTVSVPIVPTDGLPSAGVSGAASTPARATPSTGSVALPPKFPLPSGAKAQSGVQSDDELDAVIAVRDAASAASFWKRALPGAGYTVLSTDSGLGMYEVRFSGHGCVGDSQLAIGGTSAALQCDLK